MDNEEQEKQLDGYEPPVSGGWTDYPLDELAIRDERRAASDVVRRIEKGRFVLDPDFQRGFVWDREKQSRLIESILLRIPLPVFYVAEDKQGRLIVVDGRQRLTTLQRFLTNELSLHLEDREEIHGKKFNDLDIRLQNRVEDCQLHFYIIDRTVPERARLDIFERVNGGEKLTRQQMRNAIYNGPATVFLRDEADTELFKTATGNTLNKGNMQDREMINRFCSFHLFGYQSYKGDMDKWLANGLTEMHKASPETLESLRSKFRLSMENNSLVFGRHAFRRHKNDQDSRSVINASLFDVMSVGLSKYPQDLVASSAEELRKQFFNLLENPDFIRAISSGTNALKAVTTRFSMANQMFQEVFDAL